MTTMVFFWDEFRVQSVGSHLDFMVFTSPFLAVLVQVYRLRAVLKSHRQGRFGGGTVGSEVGLRYFVSGTAWPKLEGGKGGGGQLLLFTKALTFLRDVYVNIQMVWLSFVSFRVQSCSLQFQKSSA